MTNPFDTGYYTSDQLRAFAFAAIGERSIVARNCTIIGLENIRIGDNVRIDAYTTIVVKSGWLNIGDNVHIGTNCVLGARGGIDIGAFSSLSHGCRLLSAIDDFSGERMTNSTLPDEVLRVHAAPIRIGNHVPVGSGTLILPGVEIGEGAAIGAMSMVNNALEPWTIYAGNPARPQGNRSRNLLHFAGKAERGG